MAEIDLRERFILAIFGAVTGFFAMNSLPIITEPVLDLVPYNLGGIGLLISGLFTASVLYAYFASKTERNKTTTALEKTFEKKLPKIYGEAFAVFVAGAVGGFMLASNIVVELSSLSGELINTFPMFIWGSIITVVGYLNLGGEIALIPAWIAEIMNGLSPIQWLGVAFVLGGFFVAIKYS